MKHFRHSSGRSATSVAEDKAVLTTEDTKTLGKYAKCRMGTDCRGSVLALGDHGGLCGRINRKLATKSLKEARNKADEQEGTEDAETRQRSSLGALLNTTGRSWFWPQMLKGIHLHC